MRTAARVVSVAPPRPGDVTGRALRETLRNLSAGPPLYDSIQQVSCRPVPLESRGAHCGWLVNIESVVASCVAWPLLRP